MLAAPHRTDPHVPARPRGRSSARRALTAAACGLAALAASAAVAAPAQAYDITAFEAGTLTNADDNTSYFQQAGGRPTFGVTDFTFATGADQEPVGNTATIRVDIPAGLTPDPLAVPTCTDAQLAATACPDESQIGVQRLTIRGTIALLGRQTIDVRVPLYNMVRGSGQVARFAFNPAAAPGSDLLEGDKDPIEIIGGVRSDDNGLFFTISGLPTNPALVRSKLVFWGVPGDASHDAERTQAKTDIAAIPASTPILGAIAHQTSGGGVAARVKDVAFLSMPTSCTGAQTSRVTTTSTAGDVRSATYTTPVGVEGCGAVPFAPTTSIGPAQITRDSPTGLDVGLRVPQSRAAGGLATAHVRDVSLTLPEGSTISPSAANGLQTCSDAQFRRGSADPVACPAASRVGSVRVGTPVLDAPLTGSLYLGDPLPGDRYRLLISAEGPGFTIRLVGSVRPDPVTGRLTTVVQGAPQLPFESFDLHFDDGPRSVIASPQTCGTVQSSAVLTPWSGTPPATPAATQDVVGCSGFPFEPGFSVAASSPQAGAFAPFSASFVRPDGDRFLQKVAVGLPPGLIAKIKGVPRCSDAQVAAEACPAASRIGTASTHTGPGSAPYPLSGPVYLTNAYGGGQFGFVTIIRAIAGPYDLGNVVVRQAVSIDPEDAHVTVTSDPLPQIKEGVQLRLRALTLAVDRAGFARNPTSCGTKQVAATLGSPDGATAQRTAPVTFSGCEREAFKPTLKLGFTSRKEMAKGGHPGVEATVLQGDGQAGIRSTSVALPKSVALAAANAKGLCETQAALQDRCPAASIVGSATATTPILQNALKGPVYFVKGQRTTAQGKVVATLPTLYVKLQGEATIHLRAVTSVSGGRLVTTFPAIPDAPLSRFTMTIAPGKHGIIQATRSLCGIKNVGSTRFVGHSGKKAPTQKPKITTACAKSPALRVSSARRSGRSVVVRGTVAKAAKARVRVALRCGTTTRRATVAPKKGRWSAKVALKGRCATAKRATLGTSVRALGAFGAQSAKTRTVKLG